MEVNDKGPESRPRPKDGSRLLGQADSRGAFPNHEGTSCGQAKPKPKPIACDRCHAREADLSAEFQKTTGGSGYPEADHEWEWHLCANCYNELTD